jgi:hypothetical protein
MEPDELPGNEPEDELPVRDPDNEAGGPDAGPDR